VLYFFSVANGVSEDFGARERLLPLWKKIFINIAKTFALILLIGI
jgi:hypothetical protein